MTLAWVSFAPRGRRGHSSHAGLAVLADRGEASVRGAQRQPVAGGCPGRQPGRRPLWASGRGDRAVLRVLGSSIPPTEPSTYSAASDPQCSPENPVALCDVMGTVPSSWPTAGSSVDAHTGRWRGPTQDRAAEERDVHGALPRRLHAFRPMDLHITRSLTLITWMGRRQEQTIWASMKQYLEDTTAAP